MNHPVRYRLYTSREPRYVHKAAMWEQNVLAKAFPGFTLFPAIGFWEGERESSTVYEVVTSGIQANDDVVHQIAADYAATFNQRAVFVTKELLAYAKEVTPDVAQPAEAA